MENNNNNYDNALKAIMIVNKHDKYDNIANLLGLNLQIKLYAVYY